MFKNLFVIVFNCFLAKIQRTLLEMRFTNLVIFRKIIPFFKIILITTIIVILTVSKLKIYKEIFVIIFNCKIQQKHLGKRPPSILILKQFFLFFTIFF